MNDSISNPNPVQQSKPVSKMTMKPFLPFFTVALFFLSACGLEKPPASLKFPDQKGGAASTAASTAASVAPAAKAEVPSDPKLAAGKTVYDANCAACHDAGMMGAPKPGDAAAWAPRIAQGADIMVKNSIAGFTGKVGTMPAKGGNASLTDDEVKNAVAFMADKSKGATTPAATPAAAPAASPALADGKALYDATCAACHESGMMGAPKPGDKAAWAPRIAQGVPALVSHATDGFKGKVGMMPAKGGKATLTGAEISSIVTYMVNKSK
jgi:cytochrome c5